MSSIGSYKETRGKLETKCKTLSYKDWKLQIRIKYENDLNLL